MRFGKRMLLWMWFAVGTSCAHAASPSPQAAALFDKGNSEYANGNYSLAEQNYRRILDSGLESGSLYYNLGNACFKQKRLGEAIYYWEKAQQKLPMDRDIRENLELANLMLVDRIETPADPWPLQALTRFLGLMTIRQEYRLVIALFILANLLFFIYYRSGNSRFAFRVLIGFSAAGLCFVIFAASLSWKIYKREHWKEGVVIEQKADVRSGPGTGNITVFTIHEGIKVRVYGSSNDWYQISLPNGWNGWIPGNEVRIL
jgi:tetratricopeptide (TPR) repeat protein